MAEKVEEKLGAGKILFRSVPERMNQLTQRTSTALTYAGILPFLFLSIAVMARLSGQDCNYALRSYGLAIISFLCGVHWAAQLFYPDQCRRNLLVISNIITLVAYAALLFALYKLALMIECVCFTILLLLDYELLKKQIIPLWYFKLRRNATGFVVILLVGAVIYS